MGREVNPTDPARALLGRQRSVPGAPRRVLITGAASGLGLALAEAWAHRGWNVLITDRDGEAAEREAARIGALKSLATTGELVAERVTAAGKQPPPQPRIAAITLDVTDEDDWAAAREWVLEQWGGLDVIVNNAGVATGGRMDATPLEDWRWIIDINLLGVVQGCHTFIPLFKEQGHGHVVNTASLAGLLAPPFMSSYNVVKSGVIALSETLRFELAPYGINTTVVCPNFFKTNLADSMRTPDPAMAGLIDKLVTASDVPAEKIAEQVVYAVDEGKFLVLTDRDGKIAWFVRRYVPALYRSRAAQAGRRLKTRVEKQAAQAPPA